MTKKQRIASLEKRVAALELALQERQEAEKKYHEQMTKSGITYWGPMVQKKNQSGGQAGRDPLSEQQG